MKNHQNVKFPIVIVGRRAQQIIAVAFTYQNHINIIKELINYGI